MNTEYFLVFDIETIPNYTLSKELTPQFSEGRLKDPVKIETAKKEWDQKLVKKMSVNPDLLKIISIAYILTDYKGREKTRRTLYQATDERTLIEDFHLRITQLKDKYKYIKMIGWNIKGFDIPAIWKCGLRNGLKHNSIFTNYADLKNVYRDDPAIDLMHIWAGTRNFASLEDCALFLGLEGKHEGMSGDIVYRAWEEGCHLEIEEYCMGDVELTLEVAKRIFF